MHKYQRCDDWILEQIAAQTCDLYLLCGIDVPWEYDLQREHPSPADRLYLYNFYKHELQQGQQKFVELHGNSKKRLQSAIKAINSLPFAYE